MYLLKFNFIFTLFVYYVSYFIIFTCSLMYNILINAYMLKFKCSKKMTVTIF